MGRVLAIDVGAKRCGLAVTDPLKISVNPLAGVPRDELMDYLEHYFKDHDVEILVLGLSQAINGQDNPIMKEVRTIENELIRKFPSLVIDYQDEFNSSKEAARLMVDIGVKKKNRRKKENVDILSASIILQRYLGNI